MTAAKRSRALFSKGMRKSESQLARLRGHTPEVEVLSAPGGRESHYLNHVEIRLPLSGLELLVWYGQLEPIGSIARELLAVRG